MAGLDIGVEVPLMPQEFCTRGRGRYPRHTLDLRRFISLARIRCAPIANIPPSGAGHQLLITVGLVA